MAPVALAFAVLDASNSPSALGIVLAANLIPHLLLLLVGGASADRFSRRTVLVAANLGSALTQGAVAAILLTGAYSLPLIVGLEFANGAIAAFTTPALRGVVPELVDAGQLQKANALLGSARNATRIIGPTVAGVLVVGVGSGPAIAFDAATYLLAALFLLRLDASKGVKASRRPAPRCSATSGRAGPTFGPSGGCGRCRWLSSSSTSSRPDRGRSSDHKSSAGKVGLGTGV